mmetsp:Transcript_805/g.1499  ORF Transcript_805/g.1499 Transcript_805/m.1499 type:complete len:159 (-) Transcript_805:898-1374(-)
MLIAALSRLLWRLSTGLSLLPGLLPVDLADPDDLLPLPTDSPGDSPGLSVSCGESGISSASLPPVLCPLIRSSSLWQGCHNVQCEQQAQHSCFLDLGPPINNAAGSSASEHKNDNAEVIRSVAPSFENTLSVQKSSRNALSAVVTALPVIAPPMAFKA